MLTVLLYGLLSGVLGTTIGGVTGIVFNKDSKKLMSLLLSFAGGIMLALVCFDLIPESLRLSNIALTLAAVMLGVLSVLLLNDIIDNALKKQKNLLKDDISKNKFNLVRAGLMMTAAIAIHNFPEGLAIGVEEVIDKGLATAILIALHDIPEGIAMAVPLRIGGFSRKKTILLCALSGIPTVIGAVIGYLIGNVSPYIIATCVAAAGGAMLYVIFAEMFTKSNDLYDGRLPAIIAILGVLSGLVLISVI